jgi:hypothetical protein
VPFGRRRKYEDRLGVVELPGNRLHLRVGQSTRVRNHGEWVSSVQVVGKNVSGVKRVRHASKNVRRVGAHGYQPVALNKHSKSP